MELKGKTIGFAVTGSHCTYAEVFPPEVITQLPSLHQGQKIISWGQGSSVS